MSVNLDTNVMQQLQAEQRALLDTIDELRVLGLGTYVELPQLIVVGDQSAGKSSVLEAISRVRFPIKDGVCTRFATELALRRSPQTKIEVKIQNDNFDAFNRSGFDKGDLPRIVEEAKQHMGITSDSTRFSEDVLRIEIAGPDVPQLTLVDLPGFFHDETENQGTGEVEIVNRLAEKYMSQENSIILAVVSAQHELAAQKVLGEAKKHDPNRNRTLGIITKPDKVVEKSNNEGVYLRLARNEDASHKLRLGWHALRNRAQKEADSTDAERDEDEKYFFQSGVWSAVSFQDRGIETLREKLSEALLSHIRQKLPGLITNIEEHVKTRQTRLKKLGDPRSTADDMKRYLINISNRFQRVARDAIHGNYTDEFFGGLYPDPQTAYEDRRIKKLRALVRDMNRAFDFVLTTKGGRRQIRQENETPPTAPSHLEPLIALYTLGEHIEISIHDLIRELEKVAWENQGVEFPGSTNDKVALTLFRDQSASWEAIANQHVEMVTDFSRRFVEDLVGHLVGPDTKTADALIKNVVTPYFEQKQVVLQAKVSELLQHYKTGSDPQPMYNIFLDRVDRQRRERFAHVRGVLFVSEFNAGEAIDNAIEYYKVGIGLKAYMSLRVFTDNVMTLALENCLMSDIPNILSPEKVYDMTDDKVTTLAAESKQIRREREELQIQLEKLRMGLAVCREHRPRHSNVGIMAKLPVFPIAKPQPAPPKHHEAEAVMKSKSQVQPMLQATSQASYRGASSDAPAEATQEAGKPGSFGHVAVVTPSTSGASKQSTSAGGLFATAPPSALPSTGSGSSGSSTCDTPKSENTVGPSSLPTLSAAPPTGTPTENPSFNAATTASGSSGGLCATSGSSGGLFATSGSSGGLFATSGSSGGLFGAPRTATPAENPSSNTATTTSGSSGGLFGAPRTATPAENPSSSTTATASGSSGGLFGAPRTATPAENPSSSTTTTASGSSGGLFGAPRTATPAENPSSSTTTTASGSSGGLFGAPRTATPAENPSSSTTTTASGSSGGSLFGSTSTGTPAQNPSSNTYHDHCLRL
ncbi:hypothetical protein B0I37DRAFT_431099 [Chaetomium sp. MPI-CAGE-AT-0009]|nr:hypothetical protein B0I37DRAFT_431099 [Chaetomium sp. MPI-CAGE-AT-0009]